MKLSPQLSKRFGGTTYKTAYSWSYYDSVTYERKGMNEQRNMIHDMPEPLNQADFLRLSIVKAANGGYAITTEKYNSKSAGGEGWENRVYLCTDQQNLIEIISLAVVEARLEKPAA